MMHRLFVVFSGVLGLWSALALVSPPAAAQTACAAGTTVSTANGAVCGTQVAVTSPATTLNVYQGIPFAQPPVGALRWAAPQPPANWSGTLAATQAGNVCPQASLAAGVSTGSEDCLYLNVWKPAGASAGAALPVMLYIYGGAFIIGSGSAPLYNGAQLAAGGNVIVVTFNYRLGALGFLAASDSKVSLAGNFGLLDQRAAMQWVQTNIAAFGGDPSKVTIFGESAGAMSVGLHLFSVPSSQTYFRAGIMESNPLGIVYPSTPESINGRWVGYSAGPFKGTGFRGALCAATGQDANCIFTPTQLQGLSPTASGQLVTTTAIMTAQTAYDKNGLARIGSQGWDAVLPWTPIVDGEIVTGQPFNGYAGGMMPKPFMFGFNRDEAVLFLGLATSDPTVDSYLLGPFAGVTNALAYQTLMARIFGAERSAIIQATNTAGSPAYPSIYPYAESTAPQLSYFDNSQALAAMNNVFNDMAFRCANLITAQTAITQSQATTSLARPKVFGYAFTQPPSTGYTLSGFPASPGCTTPAYGNVCHSTEVAYVFGNLGVVYPGAAIPTADSAVSSQMQTAWTNFATSLNPGSSWTPLIDVATQTLTIIGAETIQGTGPGTGVATNNAFAASACSMWANQTVPPWGQTNWSNVADSNDN